MRQGQCWVELHYGIVLGDAIASFIGRWKLAQKLGQNASQNSPTMQFHATRTQAPSTRIRLCLKTEIFPPPFAKKNTRAQVAYSPVHTKTLKGNSLTYISFTLFYSASKSATLFVRSHKQFDTFCTVRHRIISALWRGQTILDQQYRKAAIPDKVGSFSFSDKKWREFHI